MSAPDRRLLVETLYHAAQERDPGGRAAFLDVACGVDADLRRQVESLLAQPPGVPPGALASELITSPAVSDLTGEAMTTLSHPRASHTSSQTHPCLTPGQTFGPYRIGRLLGYGGKAEVYEAEHIEQGRRLALKLLSQGLTDPSDRTRFLREGQLAASITHPNCVYIFGSEEIAGVPVITMELLPGGTLKD
jgi:serine/threonine protein kinase